MPNDIPLPTTDPNAIMVEVPKQRARVTLDDILAPLSNAGSNLTPAASAELTGHVRELVALADQIREVTRKINRIDPTMLTKERLAPSPTPPPSPPVAN